MFLFVCKVAQKKYVYILKVDISLKNIFYVGAYHSFRMSSQHRIINYQENIWVEQILLDYLKLLIYEYKNLFGFFEQRVFVLYWGNPHTLYRDNFN